MLLGGTIGFAVWWGGRIAVELLPRAGHDARITLPLIVLSLAGWVYWVIHLVRMTLVSRAIASDPRLRSALNDERVREARLKAFAAAFWIMLLAQAPLLLAALFLELPARAGGEITIFAGVVGAGLAFLHYDRES